MRYYLEIQLWWITDCPIPPVTLGGGRGGFQWDRKGETGGVGCSEHKMTRGPCHLGKTLHPPTLIDSQVTLSNLCDNPPWPHSVTTQRDRSFHASRRAAALMCKAELEPPSECVTSGAALKAPHCFSCQNVCVSTAMHIFSICERNFHLKSQTNSLTEDYIFKCLFMFAYTHAGHFRNICTLCSFRHFISMWQQFSA